MRFSSLNQLSFSIHPHYPTLEMIKTALLSSENFQSAVNDRIDGKFQPINANMNNLIGTERKERRIDVENLQLQADGLAKELRQEIEESRQKAWEMNPC